MSEEGVRMIRARKTAAVAGLLAIGALIVTQTSIAPREPTRFAAAMWLLLVPLAATICGVWLEAAWGRWLALAGAVAVLPWALVLTVAPLGFPILPQGVALAAALLILVSLTGRTMAGRYGRMTLVSWTIVCNIASLLVLYLFVGAYEYRVGWHLGITAALLAGLLLGVLLLARDKTAGIVLVALCCILLLPAGGYFISREATYTGEGVLLALGLLPGMVTGWACLLAFGRPMWRFLRG